MEIRNPGVEFGIQRVESGFQGVEFENPGEWNPEYQGVEPDSPHGLPHMGGELSFNFPRDCLL